MCDPSRLRGMVHGGPAGSCVESRGPCRIAILSARFGGLIGNPVMMTFECPVCGEAVSVEAAGQCPHCSREIAVPGGTPAPPSTGGVPDPPPTEPPPVRLGYAVATGQPASQGLAIASLVCGIVGSLGLHMGVVGVVGLGGLVLGIAASYKAKRQPTKYRGRGMAIIGICTGTIGLGFAVLRLFLH